MKVAFSKLKFETKLLAMVVANALIDPVHVFGNIGEDTWGIRFGTLVAKTGDSHQDPLTIGCLLH